MSIPSPDPSDTRFDVTAWLQGFGIDLPLTFAIHAYAVCILVGILIAAWLTNRRLVARGVESGTVIDFTLLALVLGIVGARAFHVLTHPGDYFFAGADPLRVLYVWEGGIAIFGALIGGAVGVWLASKWTGVRFWTFADALAPGLLLAQAAGRMGNYFNQELFGTPTTLPWGLEVDPGNAAFPAGLPAGTLFHPTFLYEIVWNVAGALLIILLGRAVRLQWGRGLAVYLMWYGLGRMVFESIRIDPSEIILGIRTNVWAAFIAVAIGLVLFIVQTRRHVGSEPSAYLPGRTPDDVTRRAKAGRDGEVASVYTDSDFTDGDADRASTGSDSHALPATSGRGA
ncbi:prolipoprotein diacylglyceryl transferase [Clavibacter michiganensis]|uniref:Phosphatidylglycerol--prolipoprotein diacylglyceryl transferase n=1 Tax=Clavibacter michiganensis TaxID=28447 RepID=A0A251XUR0_9MICO|nr:prolipoprotein diacylglyceryl transferase [Clavibacter michiganensis]OUE09266.1 Prolipoprotein diacylglyceryl transferase [Clavibacter michiganensis]PPF55149.1 prolipoprotein diacylglyceryl transferase [Clavibacter michiganensis]PPF69170.1 prolipoprotein diacylglyceryl transferase [Clavibacter michiganensis]